MKKRFKRLFFPLTTALFLMIGVKSEAAAPSAPANLGTSATGIQMTISWEVTSTDQTGFNVEWQTVPAGGVYNPSGFVALKTMPAAAKNCIINSPQVSGGNTYYFRVRSFNLDGASSWSNEASGRLVNQMDIDWRATYNGIANGDEIVSDSVIFSKLYYYTAGAVWNGTNYDFLLIQHNLNRGTQNWARTYNSPVSKDDVALAVACDPSGNVYVTGKSVNSADNNDYLTIKYDTSGTRQWVAVYNGGQWGIGDDVPSAIAADDNGNVYVTGTSRQNEQGACPFYCGAAGNDFATVAYNSAGGQIWAQIYDATDGWPCGSGWTCQGNGSDSAKAIYVVSNGGSYDGVYVTGSASIRTKDYVESSTDVLTIKYSLDGVAQWKSEYRRPSEFDVPSSIIVDNNSGNVYSCGISAGDYYTLALNSGGAQLWADKFNGTGNGYDYAMAVRYDNSGNVYVTGNSMSTRGEETATLKYSPAGARLWATYYKGPNNISTYSLNVNDTPITANKGLYLAGISRGNYINLKYTLDDTIPKNPVKATNFYVDYLKEGKRVAIDNLGNALISGIYEGINGNDVAVFKNSAILSQIILPTITVSTDKTSYINGQTAYISIALTAGSERTNADIYLKIIRPNGRAFYYYDNGTTGFNWYPALGKYSKRTRISNSGPKVVATLPITKSIPKGSYLVQAFMTKPGTMAVIGEISSCSFTK